MTTAPRWPKRSERLWRSRRLLGLTATEGVPARPDGPALAWRGEIDDAKITIRVETSDGAGANWAPLGEFVLKCKPETTAKEELTRQAVETADEVAAGVLGRLVRVQLSKPKRVNDRLIYQIQIANDSPLILNGLAVSGPEDSAKAEPKTLAGLSLPPHKSMNLPATSELVQKPWSQGRDACGRRELERSLSRTDPRPRSAGGRQASAPCGSSCLCPRLGRTSALFRPLYTGGGLDVL